MKMILLTVMLCWASAVEAAQDGLAISLSADRPSFASGEGIKLSLSYANIRHGDSFYIQRGNHFGPGFLQIVAVRDGCMYELEAAHLDSPVEDLHFFLAPLLPGDVLTERLPPINDPELSSLLSLPIPGPGTYRLRAVFASAGPPAEGSAQPIWRGSVESDYVVVRIRGAQPAAVRHARNLLRACLTQVDCPEDEAIELFRIVRDLPTLPILRALLKKEPDNSRLAEAVLNQGQSKDASLLEKIASELKNQQTRDYYIDLAKKLRSTPGACIGGRKLPAGGKMG